MQCIRFESGLREPHTMRLIDHESSSVKENTKLHSPGESLKSFE